MTTTRLFTASLIAVLAISLVSCRVAAEILAMDSASDPTYAAEAEGAWKGEYPNNDQFGQNPPGMDNGGTGFLPWSFSGGYDAGTGPYGMTTHYIDGVDFPTTTFNNLGAPAFALGNTPEGCMCNTAVAHRPFAALLEVGDVFSADIDTPAEYDDYRGFEFPFAIIGFRDAAGKETFNVEAGSSVPFGDTPWRYDDATHTNADFGVDAGGSSISPTATSDGSTVSLEVLSATAGRLTLDGVSLDITFIAGVPQSVFFMLFDNNGVADGMGDPTGEHAFFFDNLKIERPSPAALGDYNANGAVDAADYVLWRDGGPLQNEVATVGMVTAEDYIEWAARFGNTAGAGSVSVLVAVPEPASAWLLSAGLVLLLVAVSRAQPRIPCVRGLWSPRTSGFRPGRLWSGGAGETEKARPYYSRFLTSRKRRCTRQSICAARILTLRSPKVRKSRHDLWLRRATVMGCHSTFEPQRRQACRLQAASGPRGPALISTPLALQREIRRHREGQKDDIVTFPSTRGVSRP